MPDSTRRHNRIPTRRSVMLEVRRSNAGSVAITRTTETKETFTVETTNVSEGGLGLDVSAVDDLSAGMSVKVMIKIGARTLTLPGQIAWTKDTYSGLKLHTQVFDSATRRAFETFVRDIERTHVA